MPAHRPGGQAQYIDAQPVHEADELGPLLDWARRNLHEPLTVTALARRANVTTRTMIRRFHATTGTTPMAWLRGIRIDHARELLETTTLPIDQIAAHSGLGSPANLRHHFTRTVGVPRPPTAAPSRTHTDRADASPTVERRPQQPSTKDAKPTRTPPAMSWQGAARVVDHRGIGGLPRVQAAHDGFRVARLVSARHQVHHQVGRVHERRAPRRHAPVDQRCAVLPREDVPRLRSVCNSAIPARRDRRWGATA